MRLAQRLQVAPIPHATACRYRANMIHFGRDGYAADGFTIAAERILCEKTRTFTPPTFRGIEHAAERRCMRGASAGRNDRAASGFGAECRRCKRHHAFLFASATDSNVISNWRARST